MKFSNNKEPLSDIEREKLKNRIIRSARYLRKNKRRQLKRNVLYYAAASIIILFGVFNFFDIPREQQSIQDFFDDEVKLIDLGNSKLVTVVLSEGEKVQLGDKKSTLKYSRTGQDVQVSAGEKITQTIKDEGKTVFNTILVPYGRRSDLTLSDGTKVWINSGSKFVYPAVFQGNKREVYLEGEAIFEVTHNEHKPFKVISANQEIEVLGTVFNVSSYPDDKKISAVLKSGSVMVTYNQDYEKSFKMTPGTLSSYNNKTKKIEIHNNVKIDEYFGWREGFLRLRNHDLEYIKTKLSRYYGIDIQIKDKQLKAETFSGKLDLKENVNEVIKTIGEASNFSIEHHTDKIILTTKS